MFRLYSKGCEYAIRALVCVVPRGEARRFQAAEICRRVGIPEPYTRKVFQALVHGGFLSAVRGPGGGYELTRDPRAITLLEVIRAVDGEETFDHCVMGLPECGSEHPCPLHPLWSETKKRLLGRLAGQTLQDLADLGGDCEESPTHGGTRKRGAAAKR
ncbi:MAG TPA: Rrf2 family transcriptional regulator [Candidatus Hydrogenedentes bacterium]|nr:Rrf2 family transcriptional regulator [Candidatus Hydrogenedentota bacterium]HNT89232.1 Rrf2 family transcriptional regulator [Candidatus Hydrogenedentota bacterium]